MHALTKWFRGARAVAVPRCPRLAPLASTSPAPAPPPPPARLAPPTTTPPPPPTGLAPSVPAPTERGLLSFAGHRCVHPSLASCGAARGGHVRAISAWSALMAKRPSTPPPSGSPIRPSTPPSRQARRQGQPATPTPPSGPPTPPSGQTRRRRLRRSRRRRRGPPATPSPPSGPPTPPSGSPTPPSGQARRQVPPATPTPLSGPSTRPPTPPAVLPTTPSGQRRRRRNRQATPPAPTPPAATPPAPTAPTPPPSTLPPVNTPPSSSPELPDLQPLPRGLSLDDIQLLEDYYDPAEFAKHNPFVIQVHPKNASDDTNDKWCFTEGFKNAGRKLLESIYNHHKLDLMFEEFDVDDVVVSCNLKAMNSKPELKICVSTRPATEFGKIRNYINAGKVIKKLIKLSAGMDVLPELVDDARAFLEDLEQPLLAEAYFLVNHPSLLPLQTVSSAYLICYELVMTLNPNDRQGIFADLPYGFGDAEGYWQDICMSHCMLCQRLMGYRRYNGGKEHLATLLRNIFSHKITMGCGYTAEEVDTIVNMFLSMVKVKLMKKLHSQGHLSELKIHLFF